MSLTIIAMTGILLGILCLMVGFFMEGTNARPLTTSREKQSARPVRKKAMGKARKAA